MEDKAVCVVENEQILEQNIQILELFSTLLQGVKNLTLWNK